MRAAQVPATGPGRYGASLSLALLELLEQKAEWVSKNIVLLAAADGAAVRSWLKDYHSHESQGAAAMVRAGAIRGAVVLDLRPPGRSERRLALLAPGSNGQLPNMDLINTVVRVSQRRFSVVLDREVGHDAFAVGRAAAEGSGLLPAATGLWYWPRLEALLRFMQRTAFGPTGWHAHFLEYNVDAVTLASIPGEGGGRNTRADQARGGVTWRRPVTLRNRASRLFPALSARLPPARTHAAQRRTPCPPPPTVRTALKQSS